MYQANNEMLQKPMAQTIAAIGGLDFVSPKVGVNPSTLQDCMNYEVSREAGYSIIEGLLKFSGRSLYVVKEWITCRPDFNAETFATEAFSGDQATYNDDSKGIAVFSKGGNLFARGSGANNFQILSATFKEAPETDWDIIFTSSSTDAKSIDFIDDDDEAIVVDGDELVFYDTSDWTTFSDGPDTTPSNLLFGAASPTEQYYALVSDQSATSDSGLIVYNIYDWSEVSLGLASPGVKINHCAWSPDGNYLAICLDIAPYLYVLDTSTWNTVTIVDTPSAEVQKLAFSPDSAQLIYTQGSPSPTPIVLDTDTWEDNAAFSGSDLSTTSASVLGEYPLSFSADGDYVAFATGIPRAKIFDTATWSEQYDTSSDGADAINVVYGVAYSGSVRYLAITGTASAGANPVFRVLNEEKSAVSFIKGGEYKIGAYDSDDIIGEVKVLDQRSSPDEFFFQVIDGSPQRLFNETARIYPDRTDLTTYGFLESSEQETYSNVSDFQSNYILRNRNWAANEYRPPGSGPITVLFELKDDVYAVRDNAAGTAGVLYKSESPQDLTAAPQWETVDLGYQLDFDGGRNKFLTIYGREFLEESITPAEPAKNLFGEFSETYHSLESAAYTNGNARAAAWEGVANVLSDDDNTATARVGLVTEDSWQHVSQRLRVAEFNVGAGLAQNLAVVGFEAEIKAQFTGNLVQYRDVDIRMRTAQLTGVGGSDNKADTTIYSVGDTAGSNTSSEVTYTLGGSSDDWNITDAAIENIFGDEFGLELDFETRPRNRDPLQGSSGSSMNFAVFYVKLTVHFQNGDERVYFWNGSSDVAQADVASYSVSSGTFRNNNAEGTLNLYNTTTPGNIVDGLEIRSAASGGGIYYGDTAGTADQGSFPSSSEMNDEDAIAQVIRANFYIDSDKEAVYGVTGAGPAFSFDGTYLRTIRAPIPIAKDKPRHIAEHQDHLVLAYPSGSILVSVVGEPTNFSGVDGASEFGFGDVITDLMPLSGNALGITCEQSTHALMGTTIDNFTTQIISNSSGAIEYTVVNMGEPIYADYRGISTVSTTENYGDFLSGRISYPVNSWIQERLQDSQSISLDYKKPVLALKVRNKSQYRLFFEDGDILTMTLFGGADQQPMFTIQNYSYDRSTDATTNDFKPTAASSSVLSDGRELLMFGTEDGDIYIMDQGTGILDSVGISGYDAYITFNPFNGGAAHMNLKYNEILIHGKTSGYQQLLCSSGVNYLAPPSTTETVLTEMGDDSDAFHIDRIPDRCSAYLPNVTDGFSLKIDTSGNGNLPHIIQAITYRPTPLSDQDAAPNRYS